MKNKILIKEIGLMYLIVVFVLMYCSHDTLLFGTNINESFITFRKIVPFIILAILIAFSVKTGFTITTKKLILSMIVFVLPLLSCVFNGEPINNYIYRLVLMVDGALFVFIDKENRFMKAFNVILSFITSWSLLFWVFFLVFPSAMSVFPAVENTVGVYYCNTVFSFFSTSSRYVLLRNTGIFREPGVFMCFLTIGILNELFVFEKANTKKIVLFIFGLLSTLSTAGYIVLGLFLIVMSFKSDKLKKGFRYLLFVIIAFIIGLLLVKGESAILEFGIFSKFNKDSNNYGSWLARLQSVETNLDLALHNPLFGIGRYSLYDTIIGTNGRFSVSDNTNTFLINFSAFGLLYGTLCICGAIRYFYLFRKGNKFGFLIASLLLFVALSNEDLGQNIVYFYIVYYGLIGSKNDKYPNMEMLKQRVFINDKRFVD